MTLSKEERAALVEALENGGNVTGCIDRLRELEFAKNRLGLRFTLTHVGEIVAELIKENEVTESLAGKLMTECARLRELLTEANNVITNQKRALDWAAEAANQKSFVHGSERR